MAGPSAWTTSSRPSAAGPRRAGERAAVGEGRPRRQGPGGGCRSSMATAARRSLMKDTRCWLSASELQRGSDSSRQQMGAQQPKSHWLDADAWWECGYRACLRGGGGSSSSCGRAMVAGLANIGCPPQPPAGLGRPK
jgi:hypothetical protein